MDTNPYEPPPRYSEAVRPRPNRPLLIAAAVFVLAAAAYEGVTFYRIATGTDANPPFVFYAAPLAAIAFASIFTVFHASNSTRRAAQLLKSGLIAALLTAAGYACFVTTCCGTNMFAGTIEIGGPGRNPRAGLDGSALAGGIISAVTLVLSVLLFSGGYYWHGKKQVEIDQRNPD